MNGCFFCSDYFNATISELMEVDTSILRARATDRDEQNVSILFCYMYLLKQIICLIVRVNKEVCICIPCHVQNY